MGFVYTNRSVLMGIQKRKADPSPAQTAFGRLRAAGIPFDCAQGRRDDKVVRNGTWTGESVAPTALGALLHLVPSPNGLG
jgi:hypothetical protein